MSTTSTPTSALSELDAQPTSASHVVSSSHRLSEKVGGIVGGAVSLVLILCLIAYFIRRSRKKRERRVRRRFTLLRWRHPRLEDTQMSVEEGTTTGKPSTVHLQAQAEGQPSSVSVHGMVTGTGGGQTRLQTIPDGQPPGISPLQKRETDLPRSIPSASTSSPSPIETPQSAISPKTTLNLKSGFTPTPPPPAAIHPALRPGQGEHAYHPTAYWPSFCTPETSRRGSTNTTSRQPQSHPRPLSTTPELFDTGFYLGRLELPTTCSRELINIPFAERQRQRQKSQLHHGTTQALTIMTPDGAVLSSNFNGLPVNVDADSHAMSFRAYGQESDPAEPRLEKRASKKQKQKQRQKHKHKLLPLNQLLPLPLPPSPSHPPLSSCSLSSGPLPSPTPSHRSELARGSREVREKVMERIRRKT
ncbi:hypothetical protein BDV10DRAFT_160785 [Aspergillus recurvatus]